MRVESTHEAATITRFAVDAVLLFGVAVEVLDAVGEPVVIHQNARGDGIVDDVQAARFSARVRSGNPMS